MVKSLIRLERGVLSDPMRQFPEPLDFVLNAGEHVAIVGPNGSGKTTLVETLMGNKALRAGVRTCHFSGGMRYIAFQETYNRAEDGDYYYQQRWNSCDSENAPKARELLETAAATDVKFKTELFDLLDIRRMLDKPVIMLSSGELRKFQIVRMLLTSSRVLAIDNPFIGLDAAARKLLNELLERLTGVSDLQLILALNSEEDIPPCIDKVHRLSGRGGEKTEIALPAPVRPAPNGDEIVKLTDVTIRYGNRIILDRLNWTIRRGENWALAGPNGSGKSTLLSLIYADNPQAYAQDIVLFGRQRGSGESIWDIKDRIGYVSSEMHRSFLKDIPAVHMVASGFFSSAGLFHTASAGQLAVARAWMRTFGVEPLAERSFVRLSSGEQRLILLARAFVKDPDLLILDEPLNGLDAANKERVKEILNRFNARDGKSMIYVSHYESDLPSCISKRLGL